MRSPILCLSSPSLTCVPLSMLCLPHWLYSHTLGTFTCFPSFLSPHTYPHLLVYFLVLGGLSLFPTPTSFHINPLALLHESYARTFKHVQCCYNAFSCRGNQNIASQTVGNSYHSCGLPFQWGTENVSQPNMLLYISWLCDKFSTCDIIVTYFFWITTTNTVKFWSHDLACDVKEGCEVGWL